MRTFAIGALLFALVGTAHGQSCTTFGNTTTCEKQQVALPNKQLEIAPQNAPSPRSSVELNQPSTQPANGAIKTAAAIAAMLVQESRNAYYASGRPCACPDDLMRNGRRCGGNSAYSRPGGAAPYCYVSDVPPAVIQRYQAAMK
jgi:hypothetical protein